MVRLENWPTLLSMYLSETKSKPFEWGENDCVLFAAKAINKITGNNIYKKYQSYKTEEEAKKIISEFGSLEALVNFHLGDGFTNYLKAKRGDVVLMRIPEETLGIVDDSGQRIACVTKDGLIRLPLKKASLVWSI